MEALVTEGVDRPDDPRGMCGAPRLVQLLEEQEDRIVAASGLECVYVVGSLGHE